MPVCRRAKVIYFARTGQLSGQSRIIQIKLQGGTGFEGIGFQVVKNVFIEFQFPYLHLTAGKAREFNSRKVKRIYLYVNGNAFGQFFAKVLMNHVGMSGHVETAVTFS